ncbi:guanine nucleotide exchange factor C9orf72-like isoform X1 [Mytilus californianus]|uniref:guanine nucleotide exchange factor C9orf72-like isoform X1 n=1 Tax=Mytilus californianus TaxID=6549 RepID=UPI0022475835|nr:guanine nucleotide exchange factor C9orf72-like isoform X1 [Mytilus californianus]
MTSEFSKSQSLKIVKRPNVDIGIIEVNTKDNLDINKELSGSLSPTTPSSKFSTSVIKTSHDSVINGIFLSHWDNILGPRIDHLWTFPNKPHYSHVVLNKVCSQSLSGEICREFDNCFIDYKFFTNADDGTIIPVFVFTANTTTGPAVHSLSLIINKCDLTYFLQIQHLVIRCMERLVGKLRILLHKPSSPASDILDSFFILNDDCITCLSLIKTNALPTNVKLGETYFCPSHTLEREFLHNCIASHLMTFGKTLVIGDKEENINAMLYTLCLFNTEEERKCSLLYSGEDKITYHHDLWLQGMTRKPHQRIKLPVHELLYSKYPSSVIDITAMDIKQSPHFSDHIVHSHNSQRNELLSIMGGENTVIPHPTGDILTSVSYTETLVHSLLEDLDKLPPSCGVREAFISQFMRTIHMKALCLIKYLEGETNSGVQPFRGGLKKIRHDLCLPADGDLMIVLAAAEKLKPGLYWFIMREQNNVY